MTMLVRGGAVTGSALPATATTGQVLSWNGSAWVAATPSATGTTPNATPTVPGLVQLAGDLAGTATAPTVTKINGAAPATVATSGAYNDLTGRPVLAPIATSGAYTDLSGRPTLATVATTGAYTDLTGRPALAPVATSGSYGDLTSRPLLAAVATSGSYADLTGAPSVPPAAQTAFKAAASSATSSTTKTADPALQFATVAAGTHLLEVEGYASCANASVNLAWSVTGTATFSAVLGLQITGPAGGTAVMSLASTSATTVTVGAGTFQPFRVSVPVVVTAAGSLAFAWAQGTPSAAAVTLNAGAWARLTKVA